MLLLVSESLTSYYGAKLLIEDECYIEYSMLML